MRIHVLSDLHLENSPWTYVPVDADLIVLAGDIADRTPVAQERRTDLLTQIAAVGVPTAIIIGNHEGWGDTVPRDELRRELSRGLPAHLRVLDRDAWDVGGVRVLGASLWTDFNLVDGVRRRGVLIDGSYAMHAAGVGVADFRYLCIDGRPDRPPQLATPADMAAWHDVDRVWLENQIRQADRPVVVVTHFLPSPASVAPRHAGSILTPYFASDCRDLFRPPVAAWIHGHTHDSCDYRESGVRVVCNPRGNAPAAVNEVFDGRLVIEI